MLRSEVILEIKKDIVYMNIKKLKKRLLKNISQKKKENGLLQK
jgi:hypothetical protein